MGKFFQGWYFKCTGDGETLVCIPALHDDGKQRTASLQIISKEGAFYLPYPSISHDHCTNSVIIGNNRFSPTGIHLEISEEKIKASGNLTFSFHQRLKKDIMGPFQYFPIMQCRHKIYSMSHAVKGEVLINDKKYLFSDGKGYLEGDRGFSFPREYLWTQCHFPGGSLMLSVAKIPMPGFCFTGIIASILLNGREYRLATYLGAKVEYLKNHTVCIRQGNYRFTAKLLSQNSFPLYAPRGGSMSRFIRESPACTASYCFCQGEKVLLDFQSDMASFEFEYNLIKANHRWPDCLKPSLPL